MTPEQITPAELLPVAEEAARAAGIVALQGFRGQLDIRSKGGQDIVTQYDTAAEEAALAVITAHFPDHAILAEESGASSHPPGSSPYLWAIDPIDGTHNYAMQLPFWCSSVAVLDAESGQVRAGVVYDPLHGEIFSAVEGGGAQLNGVNLCVSDTARLKDASLCFDIGYNPDVQARLLAITRAVLPGVNRLRLLGSAALALTYVAAGRTDGYYHLSLQPWDIAAASLLVREAGGSVTGWHGEELRIDSSGAVATNPTLHPQLLSLIRSAEEATAGA
jgi:myo-inositol-1(or 4)-monophosphatase